VEELKTRGATLVPMTPNVTLIDSGIHIQQDQYIDIHVLTLAFSDTLQCYRRALGEKVRQWNEHKLVHIKKEIQHDGNQLQLEIGKWRKMQIQLMPTLGDIITVLPPCKTHREILCLPSNFTKEQCDELQITHLEVVEIQLQDGEAQDTLWDLRMTVRNINTLTFQKQVEAHGQEANTRAYEAINHFRIKCHLLVMKYNAAHTAMIALGCMNIGDNDNFPPLSEADMRMKHSEKPYQLGDGKCLGGPLFTTGVGKRVVLPNEPGVNISWLVLCVCTDT